LCQVNVGTFLILCRIYAAFDDIVTPWLPFFFYFANYYFTLTKIVRIV